MADNDQNDPFLWDEDRVVQELCTENRSWKAPSAKRLPDPAALEARLRECGVDGESLLTYSDEFDFDKLWAYLGIKKLPHQLSLKEAITQFRRRSKRYQEWKTQKLADSQLCGEDQVRQVKEESHPPADPVQVTPAPVALNNASTTPVPQQEFVHDPARESALPAIPESCTGVLSPAPSALIDQESVTATGIIDEPAPPVVEEPGQEPPTKKRRIAPTAISMIPTGASSYIPTEADIFTKQDPTESILETDDGSGFLGPNALPRDELIRPALNDDSADEEMNFMVVGKRIPPGRRLQVASVMRRFLRSDLLAHLEPSDDNQSQDSTDPVLPVFGESDDEVDSVTWREFQEEERERQAREAREAASKVKSMSKEEVAEAVQKAIEELEAKWEEKKKPKWELKAWKLWQDALRSPSRHTLIENARTRLRHLNDRLVKFSNEIIKSIWKTNEDISRQLGAWLEETVFQRKYEEWYISLVQSLRPPPKPETLPRVRKPKPKPQVLDDSEELTSESDGLDGFIEYDEDDQMIDQFGDDIQVDDALGDAMGLDDASPQAEDGAEAPSSPPAMDQDDTATGAAQDEESDASLPEPSATPRKIKVEKSTEAAPATPVRFGTSPHQAIEIGSSPAPCEQAGSADGLPGFGDLESLQKIKDYGIPHWEEVKDGERLLVAVLCDWHEDELLDLHGTIQNRNHKELWTEFVQPVVEEGKRVTLDSMESIICRLFDVYFSKKAKRMNKPLRPTSCNRIRTNGEFFRSFCSHLKRVVSVLLGVSQPSNRVVIKTPRSSQRSRNVEDDIEDDLTDLEESSPDDAPISSTKKKRRRKRRDKGAADLRANITTFNEELERRARRAREQMASQGTVSSKQSRLIVNETKESDDLPFIYINDHIGAKIKDHQIEGVRFMWNQVVVHSKVRQGCLLAHTMGLGKTMQVITLLVVIAESSRSPDEGVRSQIPENLREGKTLILCPPSLLNNWEEEIHLWAPNGVLGPVNKLDGLTTGAFRKATVKAWAKNGGVLIIGYSLFSSLMLNSNDDEIPRLLQETPSLVVGDEAHYMKNPASQRHQATANFKTMNRIAMTGSPLTNNVMDYYSMINWVAPNYLADIAEFRERFANPIKEGLYMDSTPQQKRKARRMLHVLKATVEPKVHRRGIEVLVNELPKKKEFILTLPLTKVQDKLYREYVELAVTPGIDGQMAQSRAWSLVAHLSLVLAHPFVFKTHVEKQKAQAKSKNPKPRKSITTSESEDSSVELPQDILGTLLTTVNIRNIQDHELSNKIVILLRILEECRKVKDKVLVFSHSLGSLDFIEEIFKKNKIVYQRLDGSTTVSTRQDAVKKFNANVDSEAYLISTRAGGVGLNIHGANRVVIFDFKYTPADEQQAIGRAYRLGQTKPVYVYWLTVGGTFEDIIHNNGVFKTQLASRVVDKKNPIPWATRFSEYFSPPREVGQEDLSGARGLDKVLDALLDGPVGGLVRKITSTETFEREEVYELTPEEQQEAEKDIEMERLRSQNPEEYKRRERERAAIHAAIQQAVTTPVPIPQPPPQYRTPATATPSSVTPSALHPVGAAAGALQQVTQVHVQNPVNFGRSIPPSITTPSAPSRTQQPSDSTPSDAAPQPILGTGSAFKTAPSTTAKPAAPLSSPTTRFGDGKTFEPSPELLAVHRALSDEGRHVKYHPTDLITKVNAILAREKIEKLPLLDKLQNLRRFSRDPRFAEAMLSGHMEPEDLASLTRLEMEHICNSLNNLSPAEFKHKVWTTKADISVRSPTKRKITSTKPAQVTPAKALRKISVFRDDSDD